MMSRKNEYTISFSPETYSPITLEEGSKLSEYLSAENSPVLFGCRNGECGTCLVEVEGGHKGELPEAGDLERLILDILAPDNPRARLACRIAVCADLKIRYIGFARI